MSNVNKVKRNPIMITLSDGVPRELKFTLNTFAELELKYGSVDTAIEKMEKGSMIAVRYVLWLGLNDNKLTEEDVGELIEIREFKNIMEQLTAAMGFDLPEEPTGENNNPN